MAGTGGLRGSTATSIAFVAAFLGVFLVPSALLNASPLLGAGGYTCMMVLSFVFVTVVLFLAVVGLSRELEDIREVLAKTTRPPDEAAPPPEPSKRP